MPNWCSNSLVITGDKIQLKKLVAKAKVNRKSKGKEFKTDFSINQFLPIPKVLLKVDAPNRINADEMKKKYGCSDWYSWRTTNWGIKWDVEAYGGFTDKDKEVAIYNFDSPWGPPCEAILKISKLFPKLKFENEYNEGGMAFAGIFEAQNGKRIQDRTWDVYYCQECSDMFEDKTDLNKKGICKNCSKLKK